MASTTVSRSFCKSDSKLLLGSEMVVPYSIVVEEQKGAKVYLSSCPNFVTTDTEYVAFNQINEANKKANNMSWFNFCRQFYGAQSHVLDLMLILDYIVLNEDRHFGNFGMIRDTNTGAFIGPAPTFDTGSSLFFDTEVVNKRNVSSKPFSVDFDKQIKLVEVGVYQDQIKQVKGLYKDVFWESFEKSPEPQGRKEKLVNAVGKQIDALLTIG